ncbi:hypothetical protein [Actinomadura sp. BRA 177]|uniref:hypothetical protein n=1 Tax=Actinomadura sp. BRA 177 TaxID=2745202 RepID=UPI0015951D32|nr:hypothetical protein [Actinomadura sp. BRA 177]NVI87892.1 hypothetical protein [Actinomadura sp. BRA 177]
MTAEVVGQSLDGFATMAAELLVTAVARVNETTAPPDSTVRILHLVFEDVRPL